MKPNEIQLSDAFIDAFDKPQILVDLKKNERLKKFLINISRYTSFARGYIAVMPDEIHIEISKKFGDRCRDVIESIIDSVYYKEIKYSKDELKEAVLKIFPDEFLACYEQNAF